MEGFITSVLTTAPKFNIQLYFSGLFIHTRQQQYRQSFVVVPAPKVRLNFDGLGLTKESLGLELDCAICRTVQYAVFLPSTGY